MRTMRRIMNAGALAAVCALTLTGCSREVAEKEYGAVKFGFSAAPTATRTQFQYDATPSGRGITSEHVYWKNGDAVTVCSDVAMNVSGTSHSAVYTVSSSSDDKTKVPASSADGLRWQGDGTHKFFAVYGSDTDVNMTKATGSMPATQSLVWNTEKTVGKAPMEYGFMVSTKASVKSDVVELQFNQIYTAFQFTVGSGDNAEVALTSFTLKSASTALAGGFEVDYSSTLPTAISRALDADSKSVTVNFPENFKVASSKPVTFTVLALGQTLKYLSIEFTGPVIGTRKLDLKNNNNDKFIEFAPGTKHIINGLSFPNLQEATGEYIIWEQTAIGEPISWQDDGYVLGHVDPTDLTYLGGTSTNGAVVSYKVVDGNMYATPWTVLGYYPTEADAQAGRNPYADLPATGWVTSFPATGFGAASTDGESVSIDYDAAEGEFSTISIEDEINEEIASNTIAQLPPYSSTNRYNLSNPSNPGSEVIVESANSYIVNGPGYYRIPIVMGNGVKNNTIYEGINGNGFNYTGFYTSPSGGSMTNAIPYGKYYLDYKGQNITCPLVHKSNSATTSSDKAGTPTSAFVVWEDPLLIETDGNTSTTNGWNLPSGAITKSEGVITKTGQAEKEDVYWLNFRVGGEETDVKQGNAVIAVADESGTVMWSYHIWVTNYRSKDGDIQVQNTGGGSTRTYKLMACNFGWVYKQVDNNMHYPLAEMYVRIRQDESGKIDVMKVERPENSFRLNYHDGYGPAYQWGRKDALHPVGTGGMTTGGKNMNAMDGGRNKDFTFVKTNTAYPAKKYIYDAIKNPGVFYGEGAPNTVWSVYYAMRNMWNCNMEANNTTGTYDATETVHTTAEKRDWLVGKTIYDPSPAGYSIPAPGAMAFRPGDAISRIEKARPTLKELAELNVAAMYTQTVGDETRFIGYSFFTDETKTNTIFFPTSGYRIYSSGAMEDVGEAGYFWTAIRSNNVSGMDFTIYYDWSGSSGSVSYSHAYGEMLWHNMPQCDGFCIRPMQNDN